MTWSATVISNNDAARTSFSGDQRVRVAGQRIARRVIVHEQDPLCQALDGTFDDQFVIDHGSRYAALTDADPVENFVRCVQVKDPKLLMRQDRQFGLEKFYHIPVAHNLVTLRFPRHGPGARFRVLH